MADLPIEDITGLDSPAAPVHPVPDMPRVSVVVPAYNEESILAASLDRLYRYLDRSTTGTAGSW